MTTVIEASGLGKRYGRRWALADCTLAVPAGRVTGLVGPNGAGKTTLLQLAAGLLEPDSGTISVLGERPADTPGQLARFGFLAQDAPVYAGLSVAGHLRMGAWLNQGWDTEFAKRRLSDLGLNLRQRAGSLSGGRAPSSPSPWRPPSGPSCCCWMSRSPAWTPSHGGSSCEDLMETVAEQQVSVVLSSHLIADIERVCDYLIILTASRVRLAGETEALLATHHRLSGPRRDPRTVPASWDVIEESHAGKQSTLLVRTSDPAWTVRPVSLEDMVLAYMSQPGDAARAGRAGMEIAS